MSLVTNIVDNNGCLSTDRLSDNCIYVFYLDSRYKGKFLNQDEWRGTLESNDSRGAIRIRLKDGCMYEIIRYERGSGIFRASKEKVCGRVWHCSNNKASLWRNRSHRYAFYGIRGPLV